MASVEIQIHVTSMNGDEIDVSILASGTLEELHEIVANQLNLEIEQIKLVNGAMLLVDQGTLASAGIDRDCALLATAAPLDDLSGHESRYKAWCGPCVTSGSALHTAAGTNDVQKVKDILAKRSIHVNATNRDNETALHHAARCGCLDTAMLLVEYSADVNAQNAWSNTVLQYACFRHPYDELVNNTSQVGEVEDHVKNVAAARHNLRAMITLLILAGADVEFGGDGGTSAADRLQQCSKDPVSLSILGASAAIHKNGLCNPESVAEVCELPPLKLARPSFKLLLERDSGRGYAWASWLHDL